MRDGKYPRNFPSHMTPLTKRSKPPQQKSTKSLIPPSHSPLPWSGTPLMRLYFQLQVQTLSSQITTWKSRTNLSQLRTFLGLGKGTRSYSWKMVSTLFGLWISLRNMTMELREEILMECIHCIWLRNKVVNST